MSSVARVPFIVDFYNIQVGRHLHMVIADLDAIAAGRAHVIILVEAVGYSLPRLKGYGEPVVRDRSSESRANTAIYVRDDLEDLPLHVIWHDLETVWEKVHHDGMHAPRSFPEIRLNGIQIIGVHQIQRWVPETARGQKEGVDLLVSLMKPKWTKPASVLRPRGAFGDFNWPARDPSTHGPMAVAQRIRGFVMGNGIDCGVVRRFRAVSTLSMTKVGGRTMGSDHKHVVRFVMKVPARFLRKRRSAKPA